MSIPAAQKYILDFEHCGLGLFIHWGLYSQLGKGEWIWNFSNMKKENYIKLFDSFTAEDFDAEQIVTMAKNAGFKYITLTTRHHEGFSLYDTRGLSKFDAPHSPAGRDLVGEFADSCRKHGIVPFFYHTTLDWYNDLFENDFDSYLEYLRKSVEILCRNYGKIGGLWFDGNWSKPNADWKEDALYATIRRYQPEAMIINNTGLSERGRYGNPEIDAVTYENGMAAPINREGMKKYIAGEMCNTINDHWGYGKNDINYKSPGELIKNLCSCRRVGANYLFNIGPEAQGGIDPYQEQLIGLVGKWMHQFGESIYEGTPYGAGSIGNSFILKSRNGKFLYLFVPDIGICGSNNVVVGGKYTGAYSFGGVTDEIKDIEWMDNGEKLKFIQGSNMLSVDFTGTPYGTSFPVRVAKAEIK